MEWLVQSILEWLIAEEKSNTIETVSTDNRSQKEYCLTRRVKNRDSSRKETYQERSSFHERYQIPLISLFQNDKCKRIKIM